MNGCILTAFVMCSCWCSLSKYLSSIIEDFGAENVVLMSLNYKYLYNHSQVE